MFRSEPLSVCSGSRTVSPEPDNGLADPQSTGPHRVLMPTIEVSHLPRLDS